MLTPNICDGAYLLVEAYIIIKMDSVTDVS